ncbi:Tetratricopeptide repeat-containing domain [Plasmopara halstedii]|uniref:peptidylprolyl isomerase n=1 Tax=Plasmopara halstedii TaxID=4781 RepID=A0A0N7L6Z9_PLAHL|nr:Tetratricopeptide repeat-containing domain [Plasmopara halstedii]CEG45683.1 Tetratricopeptide repeat-containing domain [Plasmopara halstedii]|eukprot:XP_024582052.1 Tetratricopeptide repeat-containing domain [Plasmopara halstedii]
MSSVSYSAWTKFDVEKELLRVDEVEKHEIQQKLHCKQLQAKKSIEDSAAQAAQQSADILAAQAAVAALKAKNRVRKGQNTDNNLIENAKKLENQAALYAEKYKLFQQILENRRDGDKALSEMKEAKLLYEKALTAIEKLENLAPKLLEQEQEEKHSVERSVSQECNLNSNQNHLCGKNDCSEGEKTRQKVNESLPKANDLRAIIKMFYIDVYMGIGSCDLNAGRLAAATEAFKEVLIRDDKHILAWLKRGEAFERMQAPLLAMLHYNRITSLDSEHDQGKKALDRVKCTLLKDGDAANDKIAISSMVTSYTEGLMMEQVLERIQWMFVEANVLAMENFYDYSTTKYHVILGCLETVQRQWNANSLTETAIPAVLKEIAISCHLNIASGYVEMQRNYMKGLSHCEHALKLDSKYVTIHFRMGELYHALHNYEKAIKCFEIANSLVPDATSNLANELRTQMLSAISKRTDKCKFDRNQYDLEYLQSLKSI